MEAGYWSPCALLVWNPVKAPDIRFSSSHFGKQHLRHEKAMSRTTLAEAIYAWPYIHVVKFKNWERIDEAEKLAGQILDKPREKLTTIQSMLKTAFTDVEQPK
ncbi:unnamed protein product [Schistosoma curassoni]|uniref:Integrase n=1 Tax=Schistosoma curassoni TaxID=6186 RepID=A0A183L6T1_9TREM|nr:unnamed protein product [Schistosoma curassoni]